MEELTTLLNASPSKRAFYDIMKLCCSWGDEATLEAALAMAEAALDQLDSTGAPVWPDACREYQSIDEVWPGFPAGEPTPWFCLIRSLIPTYRGPMLPFLEQLLSSSHLEKMTMLRLSSHVATVPGGPPETCGVDTECARLLADSAQLSRLHHLDLYGQTIGDEGAKALAQSPYLSQLTHLNLVNNQLSCVGAKALSSATFTTLQTCDVSGNAVGGEGVVALCRGGVDERVSTLRVLDGRLGIEDAKVMAASPEPLKVKTLSLHNNRFGDRGLVALVSSHALSQVETLHLDDNELTYIGIKALAESSELSRLRELALVRNVLSPQAIKALVGSPLIRQICTLDLTGCRLGDIGIEALLSLPDDHTLTSLNISANELTHRSIELLLASPLLEKLQVFMFRGNKLSSESATLIANSPRGGCFPQGSICEGFGNISRNARRALVDSSFLSVASRCDFVEVLTQKELKARAKECGLTGISKLGKVELFTKICEVEAEQTSG